MSHIHQLSAHIPYYGEDEHTDTDKKGDKK